MGICEVANLGGSNEGAGECSDILKSVRVMTEFMESLVKRVVVAEAEATNAKEKVRLGLEEIRRKTTQVESALLKIREMEKTVDCTNQMLNGMRERATKSEQELNRVKQEFQLFKNCVSTLIEDRAGVSIFTKGASHTVNVEMNADDWKKWCQFKEMHESRKQSMEGLSAAALSATSGFSGKDLNDSSWLIDSGASKHMASAYKDFVDYAPDFKNQNVKLADGSTQYIMGSGTVMCNSNITLPSVLHVPSFPINLLSISCITRELNCAAIFLPTWCIFQELGNGRRLGTGSMREGLYYLDKEVLPSVAAVLSSSPLQEFLLQHRRKNRRDINAGAHQRNECLYGQRNRGRKRSRELPYFIKGDSGWSTATRR